MKPTFIRKRIAALTIYVLFFVSTALAQPPFVPKDPLGLPFSSKWKFAENAGQVYDVGGNFRDDVNFVSVGTNPSLYPMKENKIAMVVGKYGEDANDPDSLFRFDLSFVGEAVNNNDPELLDPIGCNYNFYEEFTPHGITDVQAGKRIFYKSVYDNIDVHLLSDPSGPKMLIVVRPGGDPNDIYLRFEGQDSLRKVLQTQMKVYFKGKYWLMDQGQAYQQNGNIPTYISWTPQFTHQQGSSLVTFQMGAYNTSQPLIMVMRPLFNAYAAMPPPPGTPPEWCSYFDGVNNDGILDLDHDALGNTYFTGHSKSSTGLPIFAEAYQPVIGTGQSDIIIGKVNRWYEVESTVNTDVWMTYLGTDATENSRAISYDPTHDRIAICGSNLSPFGPSATGNIPLSSNPNCFQGTGDGVVAFLNASGQFGGRVTYLTALHQGAYLQDVDHDASGNLYVIADVVDYFSRDFVDLPGSADYFTGYQSEEDQNTRSTIVSKFNPQGDLVWSTQFGGTRNESSSRCHVDEFTQRLYICGQTNTAHGGASLCTPGSWGSFPICNAGGYYQNGLNGFLNDPQNGRYDGFISAFDLNTLGLVWSTYLGGLGGINGTEGISDITTDGQGNLFATGITTSGGYNTIQCSWDPSDHSFPACNSGGYFDILEGGGPNNFIAKFSPTTQMLWCTKISGFWQEAGQARVTCDDQDNVFLYGITNSPEQNPPVPLIGNSNYFSQGLMADPGTTLTGVTDTYIVGFNQLDQVFWSTYFGGIGADIIGGIIAHDDRLFISGTTQANLEFPTNCPDLPGHQPYCDATPSANANNSDGFMAQLMYSINVGLEEFHAGTTTSLTCYPNPGRDAVKVICPGGCSDKQFTIFDAIGKLVRYEKNTEREPTISLQGLAPGVYQIVAQDSEQRYLGRILVE